MSTSLYIGRFQPFHIGHLDVVQQIGAYGYTDIIIGVGSSNKRDSINPRTFSQRATMIEAAWEDAALEHMRREIVAIPDMANDEDWLAYILETIEFDVVMSGNQWVIDIFSQAGYLVLDEQERIPIHGTDIRMLLEQQDPNVKQWLSPGVWDIIQDIDV